MHGRNPLPLVIIFRCCLRFIGLLCDSDAMNPQLPTLFILCCFRSCTIDINRDIHSIVFIDHTLSFFSCHFYQSFWLKSREGHQRFAHFNNDFLSNHGNKHIPIDSYSMTYETYEIREESPRLIAREL